MPQVRLLRGSLVCVAFFAAAAAATTAAVAANCDQPASDAERAACLGVQLRESDQTINRVYKELMGTLSDAGKAQLRGEQRAWLAARTKTCSLDDKETNRERWLQAILRDYRKTVCVVRMTNERVADFQAYKAGAELPASRAEAYAAGSDDYEMRSAAAHSTGKWYFEVRFDTGAIAKIVETAFFIGVDEAAHTSTGAGTLVNIRRRDRDAPPERLGVAADLDNGQVYLRWNGAWTEPPGSSRGIDIKLGRKYLASINSSASLKDLIERKLVEINFGARPFAYALPDGYRSYQEK
jgi:uncharacterized protein YecT (DUF1311 family)